MVHRSGDNRLTGAALVALWLLLMIGLVHGWLAFGCYLVNEHRRMVWYEIAMLWTGDLLALFWFVQYSLRWKSLSASRDIPVTDRSGLPRSIWFVLFSLIIGMVAELSLTLILVHDEHEAFQRAVPAVCRVTKSHASIAQGVPTYWKLDGTYADAAGAFHSVTYYLRERDELQKLPLPIAQSIRMKQVPADLPIVFDPDRPSRSWIPQIGWDDQNRLHYLSLLILLFQFIFTSLYVLILWESVKRTRVLPWWSELHRVLPLACEAFIMALFGGLELFIVRRFCP